MPLNIRLSWKHQATDNDKVKLKAQSLAGFSYILTKFYIVVSADTFCLLHHRAAFMVWKGLQSQAHYFHHAIFIIVIHIQVMWIRIYYQADVKSYLAAK